MRAGAPLSLASGPLLGKNGPGMAIEIGPLSGEGDLLELAKILGWSFGFDPSDARAWLERSGRENVRSARRDGALVGGLLEIAMGQWFGGRSLPMLGIAGVGVAPESRGGGVALALMLASLRSARERGFLLSALYPATLTLYRAAGYELAGHRYQIGASLRDLPTTRGDAVLTSLEAGDEAGVEAAYRAVASTRSGFLDRGAHAWRRVREARDGVKSPRLGFVVRGARGIEGYTYLSQSGPETARELVVFDLAATTPAALTRLVAFFAEHRSTFTRLVAHGTAAEALLLLAPERVFRIELVEHWMLRLVDVPGALAARGYPPVDLAVDLDVTDRSLPENTGRYRLEVAGGRAEVTRGGSGAVSLDERALAALFAGYVTPAELVHGGMVTGDAPSLARLGALFAGSPPTMSDYF
jgi:predicted acetyltransferase